MYALQYICGFKRFFNSAAFCVIHQMSINLPFPSIQIKWSNLFLIISLQPIKKNGREFQPMHWWNPYTPYRFSSVDSLLWIHFVVTIYDICTKYMVDVFESRGFVMFVGMICILHITQSFIDKMDPFLIIPTHQNFFFIHLYFYLFMTFKPKGKIQTFWEFFLVSS